MDAMVAANGASSNCECLANDRALTIYPGGCWGQVSCPMTSPTMDTICCVVDSSGVGIDSTLDFRVDWYTGVCILSSLLSIAGAVYQLLPRPERVSTFKKLQFSGARQRRIIAWLAFADLQAAIGILIRSSYWFVRVTDGVDNNNGGLFCALVSGWIQYFYTATYFWNLCYAIDVYLVLRRKQGKSLAYHLICWIAPAITSAVGLALLYKPNLNCRHDVSHVLPNYLCNQIPMLITMIGNPILYVVSSRQVVEVLTKSFGKYSHRERQMATALNQKFFDIVLVFYVCWLPNVINSLLLWTMWYNLTEIRSTIVTVWYIMAVLNPLQAVLNSLVYRSWEGVGGVRTLLRTVFAKVLAFIPSDPVFEPAIGQHDDAGERTPLVVNGQRSYGSGSE